MNVVAYSRVSTSLQAESGLGLDAQRRIIEQETARRGWPVVAFEVDEGISAGATNRPALERALSRLKAGEAEGLVVAKLDRLARSTLAFAEILALCTAKGYALVALDLGVDTTTSSGRLVANVMAAVAEWERDAIRTRTKEALAAAKARGTRMGRPRQIDPALLTRIVGMRSTGLSHRSIAAALTDERIPTPTGRARWNPGSIAGFLASHELDPVTDPNPSALEAAV